MNWKQYTQAIDTAPSKVMARITTFKAVHVLAVCVKKRYEGEPLFAWSRVIFLTQIYASEKEPYQWALVAIMEFKSWRKTDLDVTVFSPLAQTRMRDL